ncbi:cobyrinate a,c-diamide synthase [Paenibacillus donghaensis]|uniref:Cobyrinate a,c-diamide synthase n=1 Tax=Paenibacillus donghaensis TaxID=414771 RepID=A0A2Z2K5X9_9BACL|nr:cobyrinate a,c-diamide synthase [Paenibacillus donghaensis]ASA20044.1 cobyrinic acid a,c-diamide synthase [Paenibacillus donghaensis]
MNRMETPEGWQRRNRLVIAGTGSGSGKTTVTLGLMRAFAQLGLTVQGYKCGPDYIDPAYHAAVTGRPTRNLDSWMTPADYLTSHFLRSSAAADVSIIEGVMGLYDGKDPLGLAGSTAEIAILTSSPVLLVLDVRSMGRSAAATVLGFRQLEPQVRIAAVLLNRCGSPGHYELVKAAIEAACGIPVVGGLMRDAALVIPERHLGLLPAVERGELAPLFDRAAAMLAAGTDLPRLLELAAAAPALQAPLPAAYPASPPAGGWRAGRSSDQQAAMAGPADPSGPCDFVAQRAPVLAVARDAAFNFYYTDNLELLAAAGARLVEFSPLRGEAVPEEADGIYLGGGFPEEFAAAIAANAGFMESLRAAAGQGKPLYAECGGYMVLARTLTDRAGAVHQMAGLIPAHSVMQARRAALGYREVTALEDNLLLKQGEQLRGHEFHYSVMTYTDEPRSHAYSSNGRSGSSVEGYVNGNLLAAYTHIHLASYPPAASRFVAQCWAFAASRGVQA